MSRPQKIHPPLEAGFGEVLARVAEGAGVKLEKPTGEVINLTKYEVAERQLKTAVRLFFAEGDCVSIETLAGAATEIFRQLGKKHGLVGILHDIDIIPDEMRREWINIIRSPRNFFKHAKSDLEETLHFAIKSTHFILLESCRLSLQIASATDRQFLKEAMVFQFWFGANYPEILIDQGVLPDCMKNMDVSAESSLAVFRKVLGIPDKL